MKTPWAMERTRNLTAGRGSTSRVQAGVSVPYDFLYRRRARDVQGDALLVGRLPGDSHSR
jgi:hypothetical protein